MIRLATFEAHARQIAQSQHLPVDEDGNWTSRPGMEGP